MKNLIKIIFLAYAILAISCCDDQQQDPFNFKFPEEDVSYITHVQPFLRLRCAYSPCHDVAYQAGGFDLSTWPALMRDQSLVNTVNTESSLLLQVLDGRNPHLTNMGLILGTENQIDGIRTWILEGAQPD